jgi:hypothetical protein
LWQEIKNNTARTINTRLSFSCDGVRCYMSFTLLWILAFAGKKRGKEGTNSLRGNPSNGEIDGKTKCSLNKPEFQ